MLKLFILLTFFATFALNAAAITTDKEMDELKLPDGRILKHPYIMNRMPNGVVVAHDNGAKFIKYKDMPADMAKKLGYDPKKAKKYNLKMKKYRQQEAATKAKEAKAKKHYQAQYHVRMQKYRLHELEKKIKEYKIHIKRLEYEIPRLEKEQGKFRDEAVSLSRPSGGSGGAYYWRGGLSQTTAVGTAKTESVTK